MSQQAIQIPRQSDKTIIDCFVEIANEFSIQSFSVNIVGHPSMGQVALEEVEDTLASIIQNDNAVAHVVFQGLI